MRRSRPGLRYGLAPPAWATLLGAGLLLLPGEPAQAAAGDASAGGIRGHVDVQLHGGAVLPFSDSAVSVTAPPDSSQVTSAQVSRSVPGFPDLGLVATADGVQVAATSSASGSAATATVHRVQVSTPAGPLVLDGAGSQVSCPAVEPPTATATRPASITFDGGPVGSGASRAFTVTVPGLGTVTGTTGVTVQERRATSATSAEGGVDVHLTVDIPGRLRATGLVTLAPTSCEAPAAAPGAQPTALDAGSASGAPSGASGSPDGPSGGTTGASGARSGVSGASGGGAGARAGTGTAGGSSRTSGTSGGMSSSRSGAPTTPQGLAATGTPALAPAVLGGTGMVALGLVLRLASRRRREAD